MSFICLSPDRRIAARLDVWRNNFPRRDLFERGRTQERGATSGNLPEICQRLRRLALWAATS
jgi:hypothetical protein